MTVEEVSKLALGIYRLHWKTGGYSLAAVGMLYDGDRWFACANHTSSSLHGIASYQWEKVERADRIDFSLGTGGGGTIGNSSTNPTSVDKLHRIDAVSAYPAEVTGAKIGVVRSDHPVEVRDSGADQGAGKEIPLTGAESAPEPCPYGKQCIHTELGIPHRHPAPMFSSSIPKAELFREVWAVIAKCELDKCDVDERQFAQLESRAYLDIRNLLSPATKMKENANYGRVGAVDRVDRAFEKFSPLDASQLRAMAHGWKGMDEVTLMCPAVVAQHVLDALDALSIVHGTEVESHALDQLMDKMARRERGEGS